VNNLDIERTTPDILFMLFGVCGDVLRVKILYQKRSSALIQLADAQQAQNCAMYLNNCPLFGQKLVVSSSKHMGVQMPVEADEFTKDYSNSPLHRFRSSPGGPNKNLMHVCAPTDTLHLANLSPNVTQEQITSQFAAYGTVVQFKYFQNDTKMAHIKMSTVEEAVVSLIALHNLMLEGKSLKVSFSKTSSKA